MVRPEDADYLLVKILQFEDPATEKSILISSEDFFKDFTVEEIREWDGAKLKKTINNPSPYIFVYDEKDLYERDPKVIGKINESTISSMEIVECYML